MDAVQPQHPPRIPAVLVDRVLALLVLVANGIAIAIWGPLSRFGQPAPDVAFVVVLGIAGSVPLLWRRDRPVVVFAVVAAAFLLYEPLSSPVPPFGYVIALYSAAAYGARRHAVALAAIAVAGVVAAGSYAAWLSDRTSGTDVLTFALLTLAVWAIGYAVGGRRAYTRALEDRAALLEQQRETEAARAVAEERARIAREMHDVVAHHVSLIVVQAGGAGRVVERDPARAREAIDAIERTGREALTELRRILGVLRGDAEAERMPQPGIDEVEKLVTDTAAAGLPVELHVEGEPRPLSRGVCLSTYRIVQEALTNVIKHAAAVHVDVRLRYRPEHLEIEVTDDGRGRVGTMTEGGHGLIGMRERAALLGGTLQAGPRVGGGFTVRASLPTEATS